MNIDHIGYLVSDLDKAAQVFEKLGYQTVSDITRDTVRLVDICFMQMGEYKVELVSPYDKSSVVSGMLKKYKNMPYHICYGTDDFDSEIAYLEENGFTKIGDPAPAPAILGKRVCFFMSARVGMIEILESDTVSCQNMKS